MTDKEKVIELLKQLDIEYSFENPYGETEDTKTIYLYANTKNVDGYSYFYCCFEFDDNEKFKRVGIFE